MFADDVRFEGFDAASWARLVELLVPGAREPGDAPAHRAVSAAGTLIVLEPGAAGTPIFFHSRRGRLAAGALEADAGAPP
ncbi:MAG: hypothetical protein KC543_14850, partial [Myxococcales bacterium]|nr:hypothetical protein [Myxococcales bacterium]